MKYNEISTEQRRRFEEANRKVMKMFGIAMAIVVAVTIVTTVLITKNSSCKYMMVDTVETVIVNENDTMWGLVAGSCPEDVDLRDWIHIVMEYNDMESANLTVGQIITIPHFEEFRMMY